MNNAELQAIQDKRSSNIQKLQNYLNSGKDTTEAVVKKVIKDIKRAEATLLENNIILDTTIDTSGNIIAVTSTEIVCSKLKKDNTNTESTFKIETNNEALIELKKTNSKKPKRTMQNDKKKEYEKFGVSVREDLKDKIELLGKSSNNLKPNAVVVNLLSELFDGKSFNVNFEAKNSTKVTSYNLPSEMLSAIEKINKKTKISKSEIFNKLLEESLKNYY